MEDKNRASCVAPHNQKTTDRVQRRNGTFTYKPKPQPRAPGAGPKIKPK